jgi:hypothetical protein
VVAAASVLGPVGWSPVEGRPVLFGVVLFIWWCFLPDWSSGRNLSGKQKGRGSRMSGSAAFERDLVADA